MQYLKFFVLQILAIIGLIIGGFLAPDKPVYPTVPSENLYDLIKYIELNIYLVLGFSSAFISFIASKYLKLTVLSSFLVTLVAGIIFSTLEPLRAGNFHMPVNLIPALAYLCGALSLYGIVKLLHEANNIYQAKAHNKSL